MNSTVSRKFNSKNISLIKSGTGSENGMVANPDREREFAEYRSTLARRLKRSQAVASTVSRQLPEKKTPKDQVFKSGNSMSNLTNISLTKSETASKNVTVASSKREREFAEYRSMLARRLNRRL